MREILLGAGLPARDRLAHLLAEAKLIMSYTLDSLSTSRPSCHKLGSCSCDQSHLFLYIQFSQV